MRTARQNFIGGRWHQNESARTLSKIDPATEQQNGEVLLSSADDVNAAVSAARDAFLSFSRTSVAQRQDLLASVCDAYEKRREDLADAIVAEIGAPATFALNSHVGAGLKHFAVARDVLDEFKFEQQLGATRIIHEPIGVCGLITPWNWPTNQLAAKIAPALATGCTMVVKPSEFSPFSADIVAEVLTAAGVPAGVFNLVHGEGETVGRAIARHPDVDMVSFTGSTRAGIDVAREAAFTVKRVHQELGGKSPNIVLPGVDIRVVAESVVRAVVSNAGQSCNAPTRLIVPRVDLKRFEDALSDALASVTVGMSKDDPDCGPLISRRQFERVQSLMDICLKEGGRILGGGTGRPEGIEKGYFVRPTVFTDITNDMTIAREEIFGPVLCVLAYDDIEHAIEIANDTPYGLAAYIQGQDEELIARVARQLRAGQVHINRSAIDFFAPFGGYKQSGNGREFGKFGFEAYLETKAVMGLSIVGES